MPTPSALQLRSPWGANTERFLWYELRVGGVSRTIATDAAATDAAATATSGSGSGSGTGSGSAAVIVAGSRSDERVMLAPAWLVAMENGLGHKGEHLAPWADEPRPELQPQPSPPP